MIQKVFLSPQNTARFICNACNRQYERDMTKFLSSPNTAKFHAKCTCGFEWDTVLEKRRYYRKKVNLRGMYRYHITGKKVKLGNIMVLDISRTGLKIKILGEHTLKDGDWIEVEFRLDNSVQTLVKRMVNIKNVSGEYLGTSFSDTKHFDPIIGFYMLQHTPLTADKPDTDLIIKKMT